MLDRQYFFENNSDKNTKQISAFQMILFYILKRQKFHLLLRP